MRRDLVRAAVAGAALVLASCGPSRETGTYTAETKESVYLRGHQLYLTMHMEEARNELMRASAMDSTYRDPLVDLGSLCFDIGMKEEGPRRRDNFRSAREFLARAENLGYREAAGYDRLCEICTELEDARGFLRYAKKNAERYPYDRQYYNLGVAYFGVEEWAGVVKSQREASEKFGESPYTGAYYRQMGRAYMKMDRDQTAERTFAAGVQAADAAMAGMKKSGRGAGSEEQKRLQDDKIGMLLLLKRLHITYRESEKLAQVERQLREAGHTK
jgi:tetratricopeptide (TPR) repeat protein